MLNILFSLIGYGDYWYNSNLCFVMGLLVSTYKNEIEKILKKVNTAEIMIIMVVLGALCFKVDSTAGMQVKCIIGVAGYLMLLEKLQLHRKLWQYCGKIFFGVVPVARTVYV